MKRLLFNGTQHQLYLDLLNGLVEGHKIDLVCNIAVTPSIKLKESRVFYHEIDFAKAIRADYGPASSVLSPQVLKDLSPYLLTTLKMMDRLPHNTSYGFDDRIQMYFKHVKYWSYILDEFKIDCFVSMNYPHEVFDYIIYTLCKVKGIKTVFFAQTQVYGIIQLLEDIDVPDDRLLGHAKGVSLQKPMSIFMERYFENMTTKFKTPFYMEINQKQLDKRLSLLRRFKNSLMKSRTRLLKARKYLKYNLKDFSLFLYSYARFSPKAEIRFRHFYNSISHLPDYSKKYIFVPLHFQPECATCPMGGVFTFQEMMIEMLLNSLPEGVMLYVKEHPVQDVFGRTEDFYKKFIGNPQVVWIKKEVPSIDLIKNALSVATLTGTAAWEALFQGKKVLLFGKVFFQYAPGVFRISETAECTEAIKDILQTGDVGNLDDLKDFLVRLEENSIRGWTDPLYEKVADISYEDNLKNLLASLRNI